MRILLIDNFDSFTFNLSHYLQIAGATVDVVRNNTIALDALDEYDALVLSPGPGIPEEAGDLMQVIQRDAMHKPILGVCLGQQALCEHFGGRLYNLPTVRHGSTSQCNATKEDLLFDGIPSPFTIGHYHSWAVHPDQPGDGIEVIAVNDEGWVMAIRHKTLPIRGVQFHPESVMTPDGQRMITNWVKSLSK